MASDSQIPVKVALRCRPLVSKERNEGCRSCLGFVPNEPQVVLGTNKAFTYDNTFDPDVSQQEVYEKTVKPLIHQIFKGFNVTVLAYGQTGSGKSHTLGTVFSVTISEDPEKRGIVPRSICDIFESIDERKDVAEFHVKVSFLEIYNDEVVDLLSPIPTRNKDDLVIREDPSGGVKVVGLYEMPITTIEGAMHCLEQGSLARTTGATAMNAHSSRSHAVFTITVECKALTSGGLSYVSKFHFVDLGGSERAKKTQAKGDRFKEGVNINLGLLALGKVISALGDNSKLGGQNRNHIPYRESKLTRLLQDSLGGNSHTTMIACVSPADSNLEETLNTLRYADRARKIKNKPIVNHDPAASEIAKLRGQQQPLQVQILSQGAAAAALEDAGTGGDIRGLLDRNKSLEEENRRLVQALQNAIDQTTDLNEKAFMAELAKEKVQRKLDEFQKMAGHTADILNDASSNKRESENPQLLEQINLMINLQNSIVELKDALMLQKQGREKDALGMSSTQRSEKRLDNEIELVVSAREAQFHLDTLLDDRKAISEQIRHLNRRLGFDSSGSDHTGSDESISASGDDDDGSDPGVKMSRLQVGLELRNIQIADLQQKLLGIDHDDKGKVRFNSIQLMSEAKWALRYLFDMCVTKERLCTELRQNLEEAAETCRQNKDQIKRMKLLHAEQITELEANYENKMLVMMRQLPSSSTNVTTTTIDSASTIKDEENLKENLAVLQEQVSDIPRDEFQSPFVPTVKKLKKKGPLGKIPARPFYFDSSDSELEDCSNDPDCVHSPLLMEIQTANRAFRQPSNVTANFSTCSQGTKRKFDSIGCRCAMGCSTLRCSCRKSQKECDDQCLCIARRCVNH